MMKKFWKPFIASALALSVGATVVSGVFTSLSRAWQFEETAIAEATATPTAFESSISVPYGEVDAAYTVYVSPDGDNVNDGTSLEKAVASVNQAQLLVRNYYGSGKTGDALILLDDGEYYVDSTVALLADDVAGGELYIRSIHANKATLSGSKRVEASSIVETTDETLGRVWKIPCTEKINQLYVNDNYGIRARYPNAGEELRLLNVDDVLREIVIDTSDVADFEESDFDGAIMTTAIMWSESYLRVNGVKKGEKTSRVSILGDDSYAFGRTGLLIRPRAAFHFENSKAFLDTSGEWYWSESEGCVYYLPYAGETLENTTVRIPHTETLLSANGDIDEKLSGVTIEGVNFKYTKNEVVDGKIGGQANRNDNPTTKRISGGVNDGRPVSALSFEYATDIALSGNVFAVMGGGAVDFVQGVEEIDVEKNMFRAVGGNGVFVGASAYDINIVSTDERTFNKDILIENNYFTEIGWQDYEACAVIVNYAVDCLISKNTINNVAYTGISAGWGWVDTTYAFLENIDIANNRVTNSVAFLSDGGPIYTIGVQPYSSITDNYVGESYNSVWKYPEDISSAKQIWWANAGIYLDSYSGGDSEESKMLVTNNYVAEDVNTQQYETLNARKGYFEIVKAKESDKQKIFENSGVQEDGFSLLPDEAVLYGTRTNSGEISTVYGSNLGSKRDGALIVYGADGTRTQVKGDDIVEWTERWIAFKTENYQSGTVFLLKKDGASSNRIYATLNVDVDYCMYGRFDENWGGVSGLAKLNTVTQELKGFTSSSALSANVAKNSYDGYTTSGWSSDTSVDKSPWISFNLMEKNTVSKIIFYGRTDGGIDNGRNFRIVGITSSGEVTLYETPEKDVNVYTQNGIFVLDVAAIENGEYASTVFTGFRIEKIVTESDFYMYLAEVAVV